MFFTTCLARLLARSLDEGDHGPLTDILHSHCLEQKMLMDLLFFSLRPIRPVQCICVSSLHGQKPWSNIWGKKLFTETNWVSQPWLTTFLARFLTRVFAPSPQHTKRNNVSGSTGTTNAAVQVTPERWKTVLWVLRGRQNTVFHIFSHSVLETPMFNKVSNSVDGPTTVARPDRQWFRKVL